MLGGRQRGWDQALLVVYVLVALVSAVFLAINIPPFQNPDETNHLLRADNIARGYLMGHRFGANDGGGIASPAIDLAGRPFDWLKDHPERKMRQAMYAESFQKFGQPGRDITFRNTAVYPPFLYAPSVAAIWIAKAGRISAVQALYVARLLNAGTTIVLVAISLQVCVSAGLGGAGLMIFALATLPMTLSLQSACSQDGPMFGIAALVAALMARARMTRQPRGLAVIIVGLALIAVARPAYVFLALLPVALPIRWRTRIIGVALIGAVTVAWTLAANHYVGTPVSDRGADVAAQLRVMLDPVHDAQLFLRTFDVMGWMYLHQIVGQLGWLDVTLPRWYVESALVVLALSAFAGLQLRAGSVSITVAATSLSALGIFGLIYLSWDAVGAPLIEGVQGRYFLPLFLILAGLGTTLVKPGGRVIWVVVALFPLLSLGITMRAVVLRYYLGS